MGLPKIRKETMKLFIFLSISIPENQKSRLTFPLDPDFEYLFINPEINSRLEPQKIRKETNNIFIFLPILTPENELR